MPHPPQHNSQNGPAATAAAASTSTASIATTCVVVDVGGCAVTVHEAAADDTMGGTGGRVWSCSVLLLEFLAQSGLVRGRHVVELGCGTGIVGIACAEVPALGAASVVLSDTDDDCLNLARANVAEAAERRRRRCGRNDDDGGGGGGGGGSVTGGGDSSSGAGAAGTTGAPTIDVCKYDWGDPAACLVEQLRASSSEVRVDDEGGGDDGDHGSPRRRSRVLVVGSDLCYTRADTEVLCRAVAGLLRHPEWGGRDAYFVSVCGVRDSTMLPCLLAAVHRHGLEVVEGEPVPVSVVSGGHAAAVAARHAWDGDAIGGGAGGDTSTGYVRFTLRVAA